MLLGAEMALGAPRAPVPVTGGRSSGIGSPSGPRRAKRYCATSVTTLVSAVVNRSRPNERKKTGFPSTQPSCTVRCLSGSYVNGRTGSLPSSCAMETFDGHRLQYALGPCTSGKWLSRICATLVNVPLNPLGTTTYQVIQ